MCVYKNIMAKVGLYGQWHVGKQWKMDVVVGLWFASNKVYNIKQCKFGFRV